MNSDYGQIRQERIAVTREDTFNTQKHPSARDIVILRGRATLPSVLTDRRRSEEIRETPDRDQLIPGKKPPGTFELPFYAKSTETPGKLPQWAALLLNAMGVEQNVLEVLDFAGIGAMSPPGTVTVVIEGVSHVLEEGSDWTAGVSNAATASSLAAAIHALSGVSAVASGSEVLVSRDDGIGDFAVETDIDDSDLDLVELRYKLATFILEQSLTISHLADNVLHHHRGCHVSSVAWGASGSDEGTIVFRGWLGNEVFCGYHTLDGGIDGVSNPVVLTFNENLRLLLGPESTDDIFVKIDEEELRLVPGTEDATTKTVQAQRAQNGTVIAAHLDNAVVSPVFPGSDPDDNDTIVPMTLGSLQIGGETHRVAEVETIQDEQITPRIDEWGEAALTGYRRSLEGRNITMQFTAYQRATILELLPVAANGVAQVVLVTIGSGSSPKIILSMPKFQFMRPEKGERGGEFARTFTGEALASSSPGNDGLEVIVRAS